MLTFRSVLRRAARRALVSIFTDIAFARGGAAVPFDIAEFAHEQLGDLERLVEVADRVERRRENVIPTFVILYRADANGQPDGPPVATFATLTRARTYAAALSGQSLVACVVDSECPGPLSSACLETWLRGPDGASAWVVGAPVKAATTPPRADGSVN